MSGIEIEHDGVIPESVLIKVSSWQHTESIFKLSVIQSKFKHHR
jgi:hypothetical protein